MATEFSLWFCLIIDEVQVVSCFYEVLICKTKCFFMDIDKYYVTQLFRYSDI